MHEHRCPECNEIVISDCDCPFEGDRYICDACEAEVMSDGEDV